MVWALFLFFEKPVFGLLPPLLAHKVSSMRCSTEFNLLLLKSSMELFSFMAALPREPIASAMSSGPYVSAVKGLPICYYGEIEPRMEAGVKKDLGKSFHDSALKSDGRVVFAIMRFLKAHVGFSILHNITSTTRTLMFNLIKSSQLMNDPFILRRSLALRISKNNPYLMLVRLLTS